MELIELCVTIESNQLGDVKYNGKNLKDLLDFIVQEQISNSTLDEADNNLKTMKALALENADEEELVEIEKEYNNIIASFGDIANEEVFIQNFKIDNNKVHIDIQ